MDGAGYGVDGTVWGGEWLNVEGTRWRRFACLYPFRLPGGDAAVREPVRAAIGILAEIFGMDAALWTSGLRAYTARQVPRQWRPCARPTRMGAAPHGDRIVRICLAVPGRLVSAEATGEITAAGRVDFGGLSKVVSLAFVPTARIGDYVLVHAGITITVLDEAAAVRVVITELEAAGEAG